MSKVELSNDLNLNDLSKDLELIAYPEEFESFAVASFERDGENNLKNSIDDIVKSSQELEDEYLKNANILVQNGEYELAQNLISETLKMNSKSSEAIKLKGQCYLGVDDAVNAIHCFKLAVAVSEDFSSLSLLAQAYYNSGNDAEALEFYMKAIENIELDEAVIFEVYKNIGNIYVKNGDLLGAEEYYNKAFRLNSKSDVLLVNIGTLEVQKSNWGQALERYREAVGLNENNDKAWVGLALVHREYGDLKLSFGNLERALDINSMNSVALQLFVDWGMRDGKSNEVISRLESFLKGSPENIELQMLQAKLLYRANRFKQCFELLDQVVLRNPLFEEARILKNATLKSLNERSVENVREVSL